MAGRRRASRGAPGQHFLRSSRLAAELVRAAGVQPGRLVVDVGAGTGVITRALLDAGAQVVALELDAGLADHLAHRFSGHEVTVVHADACGWTWPAERFSVVANLPFTGSSAILASLLRNPNHRLERAHVIVQWELAARHAAVWPATLKGTYWRTWNELEITDRLSRSAFAPAPDVDAAVLRIAPRPEALVPPPQHDAYWRFLARAFKAGKPIAAALRADFRGPELRGLADTLGFSPDAQPRDLDVRQWAGLFARARGRRR